MLTTQSWTTYHDARLDEASIQSAFQPSEKYRISRRHYPPGTRFGGTMMAGLCIVLKGGCTFYFGESIRLQAGQFAELPGGPYELVVDGNSDVDFILAWELPKADQF